MGLSAGITRSGGGRRARVSHVVFGDFGDSGSYPVMPDVPTPEEDQEEGPVPEDGPDETDAQQATKPLSESEKRLVHKLHVNFGHPERARFLRMLKAGGAKQNVLQYVRH
eukprot:5385494-Alexandrium_andersonii.AAC.1